MHVAVVNQPEFVEEHHSKAKPTAAGDPTPGLTPSALQMLKEQLPGEQILPREFLFATSADYGADQKAYRQNFR